MCIIVCICNKVKRSEMQEKILIMYTLELNVQITARPNPCQYNGRLFFWKLWKTKFNLASNPAIQGWKITRYFKLASGIFRALSSTLFKMAHQENLRKKHQVSLHISTFVLKWKIKLIFFNLADGIWIYFRPFTLRNVIVCT
jgi:hypothetical protein